MLLANHPTKHVQFYAWFGTNENTNGLIRQYFPKKTDLSIHSQKRLSEVSNQLNERPRKTLKFKTPAHMIDKSVALMA